MKKKKRKKRKLIQKLFEERDCHSILILVLRKFEQVNFYYPRNHRNNLCYRFQSKNVIISVFLNRTISVILQEFVEKEICVFSIISRQCKSVNFLKSQRRQVSELPEPPSLFIFLWSTPLKNLVIFQVLLSPTFLSQLPLQKFESQATSHLTEH